MRDEQEQDPMYDNILEGDECPICRKGFYRHETLVYAELLSNVSYWFHRKCLTSSKEELLEDMGFVLEEREGASLDL